jgi:hypothetical protein
VKSVDECHHHQSLVCKVSRWTHRDTCGSSSVSYVCPYLEKCQLYAACTQEIYIAIDVVRERAKSCAVRVASAVRPRCLNLVGSESRLSHELNNDKIRLFPTIASSTKLSSSEICSTLVKYSSICSLFCKRNTPTLHALRTALPAHSITTIYPLRNGDRTS